MKYLLFIMAVLLLAGCHSSREVQKSNTTVSASTQTELQKRSRDSINSKRVNHDSSTTRIQEYIDTTIVIPYSQVRFDDSGSTKSVIIPVRFKRIVEKKEYTNQVEDKKEVKDSQEVQMASSLINSTSEIKSVAAKGQNWAMWLTIGSVILGILSLLAILIMKRLKMF